MLWDPSFASWQTFGVRTNSQMLVLAPDFSRSSELLFGFDDTQQAAILDLAASLDG